MNIRARIYHPCKNGLYWGQVYDEKYKGWKDVTLSCFTEWGAKKQLEKWRESNKPKEFESNKTKFGLDKKEGLPNAYNK